MSHPFLKKALKNGIVQMGLLVLVLWGLIFGFGFLWYGSARATLVAIQGRSIFVEQPVVSLGVCKPGEKRNVITRVQNLTFGTIKLLGAGSNSVGCNCQSSIVDDMPITLRAAEIRPVTFTITAPTQAIDEFVNTIKIYVNIEGEQTQVVVRGQVVKGAGNSEAEREKLSVNDKRP